MKAAKCVVNDLLSFEGLAGFRKDRLMRVMAYAISLGSMYLSMMVAIPSGPSVFNSRYF